MSKIANYFEQLRKEQEKSKNQTVAQFATELNKTPDYLLNQLREAGVKKNVETDQLTEADKAALLRFLRRSLGEKRSRKKITITVNSPDNPLLKAVAEQVNGAEWECLQHFAGEVVIGNRIDPVFQAVVNLVVAKAFIFQALPTKKLGRPKSQESEDLGLKIAQEYWDFRDSGSSYIETVRHLAEKVHKDERHVMKLVEKYKKSVGLTVDEREQKRSWANLMREMYRNNGERPAGAVSLLLDSYSSRDPGFTGEDYVEYFSEKIVKMVTLLIPPGIKESVFIASD